VLIISLFFVYKLAKILIEADGPATFASSNGRKSAEKTKINTFL
jgi:hypothetical protein